MVRLTSDMAEQGKVVAAIATAPWLLAQRSALGKATCFFSIKDDVMNAGGKYVDAEWARRQPDHQPQAGRSARVCGRSFRP
jgi:protease I